MKFPLVGSVQLRPEQFGARFAEPVIYAGAPLARAVNPVVGPKSR